LMGVMQNLGSKKLTIDTSLPGVDDVEEAVTSPLHHRINNLLSEGSKQESRQHTPHSGRSYRSPTSSMSCRQEEARSVSYHHSSQTFYFPRNPQNISRQAISVGKDDSSNNTVQRPVFNKNSLG
jgi:hypothetical protein